MQWLELCHHGAAAAGGSSDAVSGGVQQRGQSAAVLLLHQDVQKQHEGRSFLSVEQQGGVAEVGTDSDEEKKHHLREGPQTQICGWASFHVDGKYHISGNIGVAAL